MVDFLIFGLFFLTFAHAVVRYVRTRDGLQRDVALVFSATGGLFLLVLARRVFGVPPPWISGPAAFLLLSQPYLILRMVAQLRPVPPWFRWTALAAVVGTAAPFLPGHSLPMPFALAAVTVFGLVDAVAASFLALEARRRSGSSRVRLRMASVATAAWGLALFTAGVGRSAAHPTLGSLVRGVVLLSALGYVMAFAPPRWLRHWWRASAAQAVAQRLFRAEATEPPERTWQRYADAVCEVAGADAAVVLLPSTWRMVAEVASTGVPPERDAAHPAAQLDELLAAKQPVQVRRRAPGVLAGHLAERAAASFVTALPLQTSDGRGALVILNRYRRLFSDDDVNLLAYFGAQAAVLAERGAVLAAQERLAAELAAAVQELTIANKAKSDFLAGMNHELRTPLNSIIGFSELMRSEQLAPDDGRRMIPGEWIEHVYTSGRHLLALISDILDLSKVEAGRIDLKPEPVDLPGLVTEVVTNLRPLVDRKRLRVLVEVPRVTITVDRIRFRQILDNLISNAIKFTPENGDIRITAGHTDDEVSVSIADTGVGIAASERQRVFEEFTQVGDPMTRQGGTGLGLALARRMTEAHGGRIELESELGRGSAFTVRLPNVSTGTPDDRGIAEPQLTDAAEGILIIEDEPAAASLLRAYLEEAGYPVGVAATGAAGLAAAGGRAPRAILLDIVLPDLDGWEVLRRLKQDARTRDIPVIIATVVDQEEVGLALGAVDYLVKPVERDALLSRLAKLDLLRPRSTTVLAIDGDQATLEIVEATLGSEGHRVLAAKGGVEGLRLAHDRQPNVIICDLLLPDTDGFSVIAALSADPVTRETPVLVLTDRDLSEADKRRLNGNVLGIVHKGASLRLGLGQWLDRIGAPGGGRKVSAAVG